MTVAFVGGGDLWCANAFYAYDEKLPGFVITSDQKTRHISMLTKRLDSSEDVLESAIERAEAGILAENEIVTGSIVLETEKIGLIRGLQFRARISRGDNSLVSRSRLLYLKRFPYAVLSGSDLWTLELIEAKFTDNRLGFGKKLIWKK